MNIEDDCTSTGVGRYLMPSAPALPPASASKDGLPCPAWPSVTHTAPLLPLRWVGEFHWPGLHWRRGEEALLCHPSPFPYFLTAHEASLVNQTHTCIKGGGVTTSRQPPVTSPSRVLHQHLGKTPWRFGGACFDLIFIYPSQRK